jgi:hypothetical protein
MTVPGNVHALMLGGEQGYKIERSLRFNSADSAYLNRTPASAGNRKTWTWSGWVKRSKLGVDATLFHAYDGSASRRAQFGFNTSDQFVMNQGGGGTSAIGTTTAVFRDVSAWYHIVFYADYANTTFKLYINNVEQTISYSSSVINADGQINAAIAHQISSQGGSAAYFDGYLTEVHFIDGQALTPSSFGETDTITGVWKPKKYSGSGYGTNGFYLNFSDNSSLTTSSNVGIGKDYSGNGNYWVTTGLSVTAGAGNDSLIDTPTPYADGGNGRGNYCTLNPLDNQLTLANGNLQFDRATTSWRSSRSTVGIASGKWYWEVTPTANSGTLFCMAGIALNSATLGDYFAASATGWAYSAHDGGKYNNATYSAYGATWTTNDVIGIAFDADAGTLTFYKNNTSQGTAYTGLTSGPYIPAVSLYGTQTAYVNFGQRPFAYTPPSGFVALNTQNLPEPSIKKPSSYMDVKLYAGNNGTLTVTGLGFSPDLVWIKNREVAGTSHVIQDAVRGATAYLSSNLTAAENTNTSNNWFRAFTSDGFTVAATTSGGTPTSEWNNNGSGYVAWCWDESATPGFDIVTYTGTGVNGQSINHNLGVTPAMIIYKCRNTPSGVNGNWLVWHKSISQAFPTSTTFSATGFTGATLLNLTSGSLTYVYDNQIGENGKNYVAYLWSEVAGFSKFGSYTGNGSSDGPFVFTGFRPAWVMIKRTDTTNSWAIIDNKRIGYNMANYHLNANLSDVEYTDLNVDILSNGFKNRGTGGTTNASGGTYVFAAFSESPFKYALAR